MKRYSERDKKIVDVPKFISIDGINLYSDKATEEQLVKAGYYRVINGTFFDKRYYVVKDITYTIDGNIAKKITTTTERPIENIKKDILRDMKKSFTLISRPIVDTGLGYCVDGGKDDLTNFQTVRDLEILTIRDADNNDRSVTIEDLNTIIQKIKENGIYLYSKKWEKERLINNLNSVQECIDFRASPTTYITELLDPYTSEPILDSDGNIQYVEKTKYIDNATQW